MKSAPYSIGHAFRRGDVPAGKSLSAATSLQVNPRTYWPDGSLRFAVLSSIADFSATSTVTVVLSVVPTPSTSTALSLSDLKSTGVTAEIATEFYGSVSWATTDWDSPFSVWVEGPIMSSWIYRKAVGTDAHLTAWLEVRLFSGGAVEVLPWVENGYLQVLNTATKNGTFSFTLGGSQRVSVFFTMRTHTRTVLINGTELSYWLTEDPLITPNHDKQYLQATEQVPTYIGQVPSSNERLDTLPQTYSPFQQGSYDYSDDEMPSSGYASPIGLLPEFDVYHLVTNDGRTYGSVIRNAFSGGRYPTHYRDEKTNRPLKFSDYPSLVIADHSGFFANGASSLNQYTVPPPPEPVPVWDPAHSPNIGYMAYLMTGRWYFMEEVQLIATANYLGGTDGTFRRDFSKNLVHPVDGGWQTRACAWALRALLMATSITPDSDAALQAEFVSSMESNIEDFYNQYIAIPNNPWGWLIKGEEYDEGPNWGATWQQDFVTAMVGWSLAMGLPITTVAQTNLATFFHWKARSVVSRLGTKDDFWYINAAPYVMTISPSLTADFVNGTGPWYQTAAEIYNATFTPIPSDYGNTEGVLAGGFFPDGRSYWGNMMPAISYAVRFNVSGAQEGWDRFTSASNYDQMKVTWDNAPVWGVYPLQSNLTSCASSSTSNSSEVLLCSAAIYGPGLPCTSDSECFFRNSTGLRHTSSCTGNKCYGLGDGATCTGSDQCSLGWYCKTTTTTSTCSPLLGLNSTCVTSQECSNGLFCGNQTTSEMVCMAYGQGAANSLCLDNRYCGDNLFCDIKINECIAKISTSSKAVCNTSSDCMQAHEICSCGSNTASSVCAPPAANPTGYSKAIQDLYTCWNANPRCRNDVPCGQCSTQICALYAIQPSYFGSTCGNSPRTAALATCGPTSAPTTSKSSTTAENVNNAPYVSATGSLIVFMLALVFIVLF